MNKEYMEIICRIFPGRISQKGLKDRYGDTLKIRSQSEIPCPAWPEFLTVQ